MTAVLRPIFKEGQILGATDLNDQLEYVRLGAVLHERTEHTWGVAQGLTLTVVTRSLTLASNKTVPYVDVSLSPGRAVDRLGRSIVVTDPIPVEPELFKQQIAKRDDSSLYPVFVQAIDIPRKGETAPGKCNTSLTTRIEEALQVSFGSPGDELAVLDQTAATVDERFGTPKLSDKVLVGWVKFDPTDKVEKFNAIEMSTANGVRIRYVGVVASDVIAGGGELTLHSRPSGTRFAMSIVEDSSGGCKLKFGKQDGNSPVTAVFSVDESGNVMCKSLSPAPVACAPAESGVTFDGLVLPFPTGVTAEQLNQGKVRLHVVLTPWPHAPMKRAMPLGGSKLAIPVVTRCTFDSEWKVSCTVRWQDPTDADNYVDQPSACTYVVIASAQ